MANADARINIIIQNEQSLSRVIGKLEQVSGILTTLNKKQLNIFGKTTGVGGDIAAKQLKNLQDNIRNVANASGDASAKARLLGNTFASVAEKTSGYNELLKNVNLRSGGLAKQSGEIKNLAGAWAVAENQAGTYLQRLNKIQNDALRKEKGLQPQAVRDAEVERRKQLVRSLRLQKDQRIEQGLLNMEVIKQGVEQEKINQNKNEQIFLSKRAEATEARINVVLQRREKLQEDIRRRQRFSNDLALGAGFPLLFGGGAGSVLGGVAGAAVGGGKGGFGAQILFSAIGQQIDQLAESAKELGKALSPLTADVDAVLEAAGTLNSESGILARRLKEAGQEQLALSVATEDLSRIVGTDGVNALREFGSEASELNLAIKQLVLDVQVGIARLANAAVNFTGSVNERQVRQSVEQARGLIKNGEASPELVAAFNKRTSGTDLSGAFGKITDNEREIVRLVEEQSKTRIKGLNEAAEQAEQSDGVASAAKTTRADRASIASYRRQSQILELGNDLLNKRVVALKEEDIIAKSNVDTLELQRELQKDGLSTAEKVRINTAITKVDAIKTNELDQLHLDVKKAVTKELDKTTKSTEKLGAAEARNRLAAEAITTSLERQLAQSKVAGTEQAKKLAIEQKYQQTLERIAKLKDQSKAPEQQALALQIKTNAEANLAFNQEQRRAKALRDAVAPLKQIQDSQAANLASSKEYNRLIMEGVLPAEAKRIVEYNKQAAALIRQKDELIKIAEAKLLSLDIDSKQAKNLRKRIDDLKEERGLIEGKAAEGPGKGKTPKERIDDEVAAIQGGLNDLLDPTNQLIKLSTTIGDAFSESFKGIIDGSMSAQQALANLFQRTADHFLDMAAQMIAAQIRMQILNIGLSFLPGGNAISGAVSGGGGNSFAGVPNNVLDSVLPVSKFANGGRPPVGKPSIVGERGPELFIPGTSGTIVPNHAMGGSSNVTVNVDASGSSVEGDGNQASQLGKMLGAAVQAELVKQKRPGGLLAS